MNWTPSKSDMEWMKGLLSVCRKTWIGTFGAVDLNHEKKSYRWKFMTAEIGTCERIIKCFELLGWTADKADNITVEPNMTHFYYKP